MWGSNAALTCNGVVFALAYALALILIVAV
jgi:hypothetical protein